MSKSDIEEAKGIPAGSWVWCLHCERCYQAGEYRDIEGFQMCPYPDCDGDTVIDARTWETIRGEHPEYPQIPEQKKEYPLF